MLQPELPFEQETEQLRLFTIEELVDQLYERTDAAAFTAMNGIVQVIRERSSHEAQPLRDRYGPLGDERSIATGEDW